MQQPERLKSPGFFVIYDANAISWNRTTTAGISWRNLFFIFFRVFARCRDHLNAVTKKKNSWNIAASDVTKFSHNLSINVRAKNYMIVTMYIILFNSFCTDFVRCSRALTLLVLLYFRSLNYTRATCNRYLYVYDTSIWPWKKFHAHDVRVWNFIGEINEIQRLSLLTEFVRFKWQYRRKLSAINPIDRANSQLTFFNSQIMKPRWFSRPLYNKILLKAPGDRYMPLMIIIAREFIGFFSRPTMPPANITSHALCLQHFAHPILRHERVRMNDVHTSVAMRD